MKTKVLLYTLMVACYPIGEYLQNWIPTAPRVLRHHLSDVGYIPFQALCIFTFSGGFFNKIKVVQKAKMALGMGLICALIWEFYLSKTDWIDVVCYSISFWISLLLVRKIDKHLNPEMAALSSELTAKA
ncbi:MAG: hypothetical protein V4509_00395 [Patescibacteria group bacterium]